MRRSLTRDLLAIPEDAKRLSLVTLGVTQTDLEELARLNPTSMLLIWCKFLVGAPGLEPGTR